MDPCETLQLQIIGAQIGFLIGMLLICPPFEIGGMKHRALPFVGEVLGMLTFLISALVANVSTFTGGGEDLTLGAGVVGVLGIVLTACCAPFSEIIEGGKK